MVVAALQDGDGYHHQGLRNLSLLKERWMVQNTEKFLRGTYKRFETGTEVHPLSGK